MSLERRDLPLSPSRIEKSEVSISSVALAFAKRKTKEAVRMRERLFELTQHPMYIPQDAMALDMNTSMQASLIDHALANRTMIDSEIFSTFNFTNVVANFLLVHEDPEDDFFPDEEEIIELSEAMGEGFKGSVESVLNELGRSGVSIEGINSFTKEMDKAVELAKEKGVSVEEVFESDELYLDLQRKNSSLEQNIAASIKGVGAIRSQLLERVVKSGVGGFILKMGGVDEKDKDEILLELANDSSAFVKINEILNSMITPTITLGKEQIERLWGTEASLEFLRRIEGISKIESSS